MENVRAGVTVMCQKKREAKKFNFVLCYERQTPVKKLWVTLFSFSFKFEFSLSLSSVQSTKGGALWFFSMWTINFHFSPFFWSLSLLNFITSSPSPSLSFSLKGLLNILEISDVCVVCCRKRPTSIPVYNCLSFRLFPPPSPLHILCFYDTARVLQHLGIRGAIIKWNTFIITNILTIPTSSRLHNQAKKIVSFHQHKFSSHKQKWGKLFMGLCRGELIHIQKS